MLKEDAQLENSTVIQRTRNHIDILKQIRWVILAMVLTLSLLFYGSVPTGHLIIWGVLTLSVEFLRTGYVYTIEPCNLQIKIDEVVKRFYVLALLSSTTIISCASFLPYIPIYKQIMVILIILSLPNLFVSASFLPVLLIYMVVLIIPAASVWINIYPQHFFAVILLAGINAIFILSIFFGLDKQLRFYVALHLDRNKILADLELKNIEMHQTIKKAEQTSQVRARVLAAASHDLRQPLQALSMYSAVLLSSPDPKTLPNVAENIDRLARTLGSTLHGLLDLSRLSHDYYVPEQQRISLDRLAADICNEFKQQADDKKIRLVQQLKQVRLLDDKIGISRIIRNLLDNAIKYTDHGEVRVNTYQIDGTAVLMVTDTGKGIPAEEKMRIYEEFYQLNNSDQNLDRGIGLGLTIVHRLCELNGIQIQLESELGRGSSFKLIFHSMLKEPLDKDFSNTTSIAGLIGKRIFIVDDEQDILESMQTLLRSWNMSVEIATSGAVLKIIFKIFGAPDLLMVDLRLDNEQGVHLAAQLQKTYGNFPVLVLTGDTSSALLQQCNRLGFPIIHKPIVMEQLLEAFSLSFNLISTRT